MEELRGQLPNMIVGIGGAGKELTFSLLDREWVLKELMKSSDTYVLIVDTAKEDTNRDNEKIHQIEINKISIQKEFRETHREYNNINMKYIPITEKFHLGSAADIGKEVIEDVRKIGINNWWFNLDCYSEETRRIINEEENFRGINFAAGVVRKRALGKAVFFRALSNGLEIPRPTPAKVAMIVGLGGGTGSGMFIDFAKKLKEEGQCDVVLFGILPTTHETPREMANAYAALCELERLTLDEGREVFKDVVLIPLEPTGYAGSGGVEDEEAQILLREFSKAFPYIFMSYYHISGNRELIEDSSGKRDKYAPFVIASPRVVRYDVEIRKKIEDSYAEALKAKKRAFTLCEEINQKVEQFLDVHQLSSDERVKDDYDFVKNRLDDFKNWLKQSEFLSKLGYSSPEEFYRVLEDVERELKEKNVNVYNEVYMLKLQIDAALKGLKESKDEIEKLFNEVVSSEINEIDSLQNLLMRSNSIEDFDVKRIVKQMIRKESRPRDGIILNDKLEKLTKELSDNENKIKDLEGELNNVERYTSEEIDNFKRKIKSLTSNDLNELDEIDSEDFRRRIGRSLDNLKEVLEQIAQEIEYLLNDLIKKEKDLEMIMREIEYTFDKIFGMLDRIGMLDRSVVGRIDPDIDTIAKAITKSVEMLKRYVEAWAVATSKPGFIDTLIWKITGRKTPRIKQIEDAKMTAENIAGDISKLGVFSVEFSVEGVSVKVVFDYPLDEKLEEYRNKLLQRVVEKVKEVFDEFGYELEDDLINELKKSIKNGRFDEIIEDIAKKALKYDEKKKELKNKIEDTRDVIEKLKRNISIVDSVVKLYKELYSKIRKYGEVNGDYMNKMEEFNNLARGHIKKGGLHNGKRIVVEIAPEDRRTTIGRNNIEELLKASEGEKEHLASELRRIVEGMVQSKRFCGLVRRSFENVKGDKWTAKQVQLYISSIANLRGFSERLNLQGYFGTSNIGVAPLKVGDKWDVGLTLFIGGVMLDNIAFVDNYYEAYDNRTKQLKGAAFLHHAYALEDGSYFVRKPISIEGDEREIFFRGDAESKIKMRYEEKSWRERDCHEAEAG